MEKLIEGLRKRNCFFCVRPLTVGSYKLKVIEVTWPIKTIIRYDENLCIFSNLSWGLAGFQGSIRNGSVESILFDIDCLLKAAGLEFLNV